MAKVARIERRSLVEQMAAAIEERILSGDLNPGDRLPSEAALAAEFGVSRPQLREALASLRERGYLKTINGWGTMVQVPDWDAVTRTLERQVLLSREDDVDIAHIYEARRLIEVRCAELAAERITDGSLAVLEERLAELEAVRDDRDRYSDRDVAYHMAIAEASGNPLFPSMLSGMLQLLLKIVADSHGSEEVAVGMEGHWAVFRALRSRDPQQAAAAMQHHLDDSRRILTRALGR